jgi:hypothetical protein
MPHIKRAIKVSAKEVINFITRIGRREILVLGDSHVEVFIPLERSFPGYYFNIVKVSGATISGLKHPKSKTQAMPIFNSAIAQSKADLCIVLLGEVDTGFVIWYRSQKHGISVDETLESTVSNYINFLKNISKKMSMVCISTPLPTIQDGQDWGEITNLRKDVTAKLKERTELTLKFNGKMEKLCLDNGFFFVNLDSQSLGNNGCVRKTLLNKNKNNHHYDRVAYANMLKPRVKKIVEQLGAGTIDQFHGSSQGGRKIKQKGSGSAKPETYGD